MVLTGIARYFELSTNSNGAIQFLALFNALLNLAQVVFKVERVVVQTA